VQVLDAIHDTHPDAPALLKRLGTYLPADGQLHVEGGLDDEMMRPLDFAPVPDRPVRALFSPEAITAELSRLAARQQDDGGWAVDFASYSPAAALEWRGYVTVAAVSTLRRNSML
jgi:hypothetical protein